MPPKLWHWSYFQTRTVHNSSSGVKDYHGNNKTYVNAWCQACITQCINETLQKDTQAKAQGQITEIRSPNEFLEHAFATVSPVSGRREGFEAHIRSCKLVDPKAKARLASESTSSAGSLAMDSCLLQTHGSDTESSLSDRGTPLGLAYLSKEQQRRFEADLCKLFIANGWAWHGINHPQTRIFFHNWVPGGKLPDRHKLSGLILENEVQVSSLSMHDSIKGCIATGMSDGWKNITRNSLLASMLSVDYTTYTVKVHDVSAERKTANNHLSIVLNDIDYAEREHDIKVIAWVLDAGGDSRAMRVRLHRMRPHILVFDCWAHQVNLVVGDILRLNNKLVEAAATAIDIIKWIGQFSRLRAIIYEMGNIHTKRRARLTYNKVFDTAVVRLDLKRKHAADGLTRSRLKRQFGSPTVNTEDSAHVNQYDEMAEEMAEVDMLEEDPETSDILALSKRLQQDVIDDEDPPEDELTAPSGDVAALPHGNVHPSGPLPKRVRLFFGTEEPIRLEDLFDFEKEGKGLDIFKPGGLANLQSELEIYSLATKEMQASIEAVTTD